MIWFSEFNEINGRCVFGVQKINVLVQSKVHFCQSGISTDRNEDASIETQSDVGTPHCHDKSTHKLIF